MDIQDKHWSTAAHYAARYHRTYPGFQVFTCLLIVSEVTQQILIDNGADISIKNKLNKTALDFVPYSSSSPNKVMLSSCRLKREPFYSDVSFKLPFVN